MIRQSFPICEWFKMVNVGTGTNIDVCMLKYVTTEFNNNKINYLVPYLKSLTEPSIMNSRGTGTFKDAMQVSVSVQ